MTSIKTPVLLSRRRLLAQGSAAAAGALLLTLPQRLLAAGESAKEVEVSALEDLMREHGVYERLMVIFEHSRAVLHEDKSVDTGALARAAGIMHRFIGDYHEKLEEEHVFPRFEKASRHTDLVKTLRRQHDAGRKLNAQLQKLLKDAGARNERKKLQEVLFRINHMYLPHIGWEDTVLFPAFGALVGAKELDALGDAFEAKEHKLFGAEGFEKIVAQVAQVEKDMNIHDLAKFTAGAV